jgi:hypothetical protein
MRAQRIQAYVSDWVRTAARAQGKIDEEETEDIYKQIPGYEIRDEVGAVKTAARPLISSLLKLESLFKTFPDHPFFGDIGSTLDGVINMIRQYRRAAGEKSADEVERKLARLADLERKTQQQESIITELRREIEELKAKGIGGDMSISEFQTAIKKWEDVVETQKNIIRDRDNEIANLRARIAAPEGEGAPIPASLRRTPR